MLLHGRFKSVCGLPTALREDVPPSLKNLSPLLPVLERSGYIGKQRLEKDDRLRCQRNE